MKTTKAQPPRRRPQAGPLSGDESNLTERVRALINEACAACANLEQMTFNDWYAVELKVKRKLEK